MASRYACGYDGHRGHDDLKGGLAYGASMNDEVFANAALRELHSLAAAVAQSGQAAEDSDDIGCQNAYERMQKTAHEALTDMHYMSFAPIDAIDRVSSLLRLIHLTPNPCAWGFVADTHTLLIIAGQAIIQLRSDYAVGAGDWYTVNEHGNVESKNPLRYAESLKEQNYSWVDVRPSGMIVMVVSDWKVEVRSHAINDPSIKNSGDSLKAVEVDYRTNPSDDVTAIYFYRSKEDALAPLQAERQRAEQRAEWSQKLTSLPYIVANHDVGFKLAYTMCKLTPDAKGESKRRCDDSLDWTGDHSVPYHWFGDFQGCDRARFHNLADLKLNADDAPVLDCVPAPTVSGRTLKGYEMVVVLLAPDVWGADDASYARLRESGSQTAIVFGTFDACNNAMDAAYAKISKDLGVDLSGKLLSDQTKSINGLWTICVRVY